MGHINEDQMKEALKDALKEWLDDKVKEVGYWSLRTILGFGLTALVYFILTTNGWHK